MIPIVNQILVWEKELELQRQEGGRPRYYPEETPLKYYKPRRESHKSLFVWLSSIIKVQRQPVVVCSPEVKAEATSL